MGQMFSKHGDSRNKVRAAASQAGESLGRHRNRADFDPDADRRISRAWIMAARIRVRLACARHLFELLSPARCLLFTRFPRALPAAERTTQNIYRAP
jgi:hypothetical protein